MTRSLRRDWLCRLGRGGVGTQVIKVRTIKPVQAVVFKDAIKLDRPGVQENLRVKNGHAAPEAIPCSLLDTEDLTWGTN